MIQAVIEAFRAIVEALDRDLPPSFSVALVRGRIELSHDGRLEMAGEVSELGLLDGLRAFVEQAATCVEQQTTLPWPRCTTGGVHALKPVVCDLFLCWECVDHAVRIPLGALDT